MGVFNDFDKHTNENQDRGARNLDSTLTDLQKWSSNDTKIQESAGISIRVTPPDGEEEEIAEPPVTFQRTRRKLSGPITLLKFDRPSSKSLTPLSNTRRRFSTIVSSAATSMMSRRLSATIGKYFAIPTHNKPQIVRQGRALCIQYTIHQLRRSMISNKKIILPKLKLKLETECVEEATNNEEGGVLLALKTLCTAVERKKPEIFKDVARQATRAPLAMLQTESALSELSLALAKRICKDRITWSKIAAVFCVCAALSTEAAEASELPTSELVCAPAAAVADLLQEEVGTWIIAQGGWEALINRLRVEEKDEGSEKTIRLIISGFVSVFVTLLLLRLFLPASHFM